MKDKKPSKPSSKKGKILKGAGIAAGVAAAGAIGYGIFKKKNKDKKK